MLPSKPTSLTDAINSVASLQDLAALQDKVGIHVSFFGGRYISAKGYTGTASIDDLARKTCALNLGDSPKEVRLPIQKHIIILYEEASKQMWNDTYLITKIFCIIRNILYAPYAIFGICFLGMGENVFWRMISDTQDRWEHKYGRYQDTSYGDYGDSEIPLVGDL